MLDKRKSIELFSVGFFIDRKKKLKKIVQKYCELKNLCTFVRSM